MLLCVPNKWHWKLLNLFNNNSLFRDAATICMKIPTNLKIDFRELWKRDFQKAFTVQGVDSEN